MRTTKSLDFYFVHYWEPDLFFSVVLLLTSGGLLTHVEKNGLEKSKQTQQT